MNEIYQAKYSFRGFEDIFNSAATETEIVKSAPYSPSPEKNKCDNKNEITSDQLMKLNKCFAKMASDAIIRSPILSVKLEKCNSEPNVSKDMENGRKEKSSNKSASSPCHSSKSEHSLAGISNHCQKYLQRSLFLSFQEGDAFEVLSKEENECWWAVRALKTDDVGFVPVSYLNHEEDQITVDSISQVSFHD
ncbi:hypothetical protein C0J52_00520 [Blattella germanica]|nr:hypothetical protein C0J52_00520 [Blattella germanica]